MTSKRQIEISVMGQKFMVRADTDDDYVQKVASYVNEKMQDIIRSTKSVASLNVAILAAMNIADELFKNRANSSKSQKIVEQKIQDMIELIDLQL